MKKRILQIIILVLTIALVYQLMQCWNNRFRSLGPGILVADAPIQKALPGNEYVPFKSFQLRRLAIYDIHARVLSKKRYRFGREAKLAPYDLAVGWKRMSDESILQHFSISQSNRFFWWSAKRLIIPTNEVSSCSANMHIIPANESVMDYLHHIHPGDVIHMTGYLVQAVLPGKNWRWTSSLSRTDRGAGACELMYVETIEIVR